MMTDTKRALRRAFLARLQELDRTTRARENRQLASQLSDYQPWLQAKTVALTMSQSFEVDTNQIILAARAQGKVVAVPRTLPQRQMEFVAVGDETEYREAHFGVLEPVNGRVLTKNELDLIVVPGLAFTREGLRLGFGGGYYDRYLADYHGVTVALALATQLAEAGAWPVDDFDVTIGRVLTTGAH